MFRFEFSGDTSNKHLRRATALATGCAALVLAGCAKTSEYYVDCDTNPQGTVAVEIDMGKKANYSIGNAPGGNPKEVYGIVTGEDDEYTIIAPDTTEHTLRYDRLRVGKPPRELFVGAITVEDVLNVGHGSVEVTYNCLTARAQ